MNYTRNIQWDQKDYHIKTIKSFDEIHVNETSPTNVINIFWVPNEKVLEILYNYCEKRNHKKILEVGPGPCPFRLANTFIGMNEPMENFIDININLEQYPFEENHFDFIYSRHVLEDICNPYFALKEMIKKAKSGFIETPSSLIECMRYIDAERQNNCDELRGFMHHRYIVWCNIEKNTIYFLPKYPIIEKIFFEDSFLKKCCKLANEYPIYWNNYFLWDKSKGEPSIVVYGCDRNKFDIYKDYTSLVYEAIHQSFQNTNYFISTFL